MISQIPALRLIFLTLLMAVIVGFGCLQTANAKHKVEQYNLPIPKSYSDYELRVEASTRRPEAGKPVILKAIISPEIDQNKVEYQFLINGAPIHEPGMHKVHTFEETGTYKISAFAKIDGSYLLNSPPIILHVIDSWIEPEAIISPSTLIVKPGQDAIFTSHSITDDLSRQWLYWSISTGHRSSNERFIIKTDKLEPGKYPVELLVKDDRKRESLANAFLIVSNDLPAASDDSDSSNIETLSIDGGDELTVDEDLDLHLHSSHTNRLERMQIVFWIQNAQPGANTKLQLDYGDGTVTPWGKKLRYVYRYKHFGIYNAMITARTPGYIFRSNKVTIYVWPLWLPIIMMVVGLFLAGIPFFKRHQQQQQEPEPIIRYQYFPDSGQHQLILFSEEETPAVVMRAISDKGNYSLTTITRPLTSPPNT